MQFKQPKDTESIKWAEHVKEKMKFYGLSETRLKRVLRTPQRTEEGVAPRTVAVMQRTSSAKNPSEIWLMYQKRKIKNPQRRTFDPLRSRQNQERIIIISAWRYPGKSPEGPPLIPEDIIKELNL